MNYSLAAFGYPEVTEREAAGSSGRPSNVPLKRSRARPRTNVSLKLSPGSGNGTGGAGYAENTLYPGVSESIRALARGIALGVCTSKRADFAEKILELFGLRDSFLFVSGGDVGIRKADQLGWLLADGRIDRTAVMIGDRAVDILAARANGLLSVGVLWGYREQEGIAGCGPGKNSQTARNTCGAGSCPRRIGGPAGAPATHPKQAFFSLPRPPGHMRKDRPSKRC